MEMWAAMGQRAPCCTARGASAGGTLPGGATGWVQRACATHWASRGARAPQRGWPAEPCVQRGAIEGPARTCVDVVRVGGKWAGRGCSRARHGGPRPPLRPCSTARAIEPHRDRHSAALRRRNLPPGRQCGQCLYRLPSWGRAMYVCFAACGRRGVAGPCWALAGPTARWQMHGPGRGEPKVRMWPWRERVAPVPRARRPRVPRCREHVAPMVAPLQLHRTTPNPLKTWLAIQLHKHLTLG